MPSIPRRLVLTTGHAPGRPGRPPQRDRLRRGLRGGHRLLALAAAALVVGVLAVSGATSAQAHNTLRSTDPADASTVAVAPDHVTLTFDEPAVPLGTQVEVRGPDGTLVSTGDPVLLDATVTQALADTRPAGLYTVAWRVTSADGHPITGELSFTATTATTVDPPVVESPSASPTSSPSAEPTSSPSTSVTTSPTEGSDETSDESEQPGAPVVAVVVVAAVVISWLLWRRRRPRHGPQDE